MKVIKSIIIGLLAAVVITSCQKEDPKVTFLGSTSAVTLTVSSTDTLTLLPAESAYQSLQFQWTNPNYQFSNGVNTQDVYYTLEIDTLADFSSSVMSSTPFVGNVSHTYTVKEFNTALGQLQLLDGVFHKFYFRIVASMASDGSHTAGGDVPVTSDPVSIVIKTYLDVVYPVPANLYITGSATPGNWGATAPINATADTVAQKFTLVNPYTFQLTLPIIGGGEFLLVPVWNSWNNKYGTTGSNDTNNVSGDVFVPSGNNFLAPPTDGTYIITVNFKTGKYTIVQQ